MSQAGIINSTGSGITEITFVTDIESPAASIGGVINIDGGDTSDDNNLGIQTDGNNTGSGSQTVTVQLTNRITGFISTNNASVVTIATFNLGAVPAVYSFQGNFTGNDTTDNLGVSYDFKACIRTSGDPGAVSTEIGVEYSDGFEDPAITAADIFVVADGAPNNVLFQVQGVVGKNFDWSLLANYRKV